MRLGALLVFAGVCAAAAAAAQTPRQVVYWRMSPYPSIWSARLDGPAAHRILHTGQNAKRPRLSPDGRWIAFDGASPGKEPLTDFDIQLVRPDGTGRHTLTPSAVWDIDAQWSPNGRRLAFTRGKKGELGWPHTHVWTMGRDGSDPRNLGEGGNARWSPDGRQLVFTAVGDLFVMDADGARRRRLAATPEDESPAAWDGSQILYTRYRGNAAAVMVMNTDGTHPRRLAAGEAAAWSPDGKTILYTTPAHRLATLNADGTHRHLTTLTGVWDPDWR